MNIVINGEIKVFEDTNTLEGIMKSLEIEDKVMAVAVNMEIVKKDQWNNFIPKENDKVELLQFVGGG